MKTNKRIGTTTQERFSRKAYCVGVVYCKPIFCKRFARPTKNPVGTATLKYERFSSFIFGIQISNSATAENSEPISEKVPPE